MFSYRLILRRAWQFAWRTPYFWFFGLFAALLGNGGEYEIISRVFWPSGRTWFLPGVDFWSAGVLAGFPTFFLKDPIAAFLLFFFGVVLLALFIFFLWVIIVSQGALVRAAALAFAGKTFDFKTCLTAGARKFWPVFSLNFLSRAVISLLLLFFLPYWFVAGPAGHLPAAVYGFLALMILPTSLAVSFIGKYSIAYAVIKEEKLADALKKGIDLFLRNWLVSLEIALLLFLINCLIGGVLLVFLAVIAIPPYFFLVISQSLWFLAFCLILFLILIAGAGAIIAVFQTAAWTMLFAEISGRGGLSKLARIFRRAGK